MNQATKPTITIWFNVLLVGYLCALLTFDFVFKPVSTEKVPYDYFFDKFPVMSIVTGIAIAVLLVIAGALLLKRFWDRVIADVFKIREITLQEAAAIVITVSVLIK